MKKSSTAINGTLILVFLATLSVNAHAECSFSVQGMRPYYRNAVSYPRNCSGDAKAAIHRNLESVLNVDEVASSEAKSQMESLSGQYGSGGISGTYSRGTTSSGSSFIRMGAMRWIVTVDWCQAHNVRAAAGTDRGWGKGRANDGYCSAEVECQWRFTTFDVTCGRQSFTFSSSCDDWFMCGEIQGTYEKVGGSLIVSVTGGQLHNRSRQGNYAHIVTMRSGISTNVVPIKHWGNNYTWNQGIEYRGTIAIPSMSFTIPLPDDPQKLYFWFDFSDGGSVPIDGYIR